MTKAVCSRIRPAVGREKTLLGSIFFLLLIRRLLRRSFLKGKQSVRIEGFDPLSLPLNPRQVAPGTYSRYVFNFLRPDRELHCFQFLENLFELLAKLHLLNIVQLYQIIYSDSSLRKISLIQSGRRPVSAGSKSRARKTGLIRNPTIRKRTRRLLMRST